MSALCRLGTYHAWLPVVRHTGRLVPKEDLTRCPLLARSDHPCRCCGLSVILQFVLPFPEHHRHRYLSNARCSQAWYALVVAVPLSNS